MTIDAALSWPLADAAPDAVVVGADLAPEEGFFTAVTISLFSDRKADPDELPPGDSLRRGWWGDLLEDDGDRIGSRLWTLARARASAETAGRAEAYAEEALAWLVEDGHWTAFEVAARWREEDRLELIVAYERSEGSGEWSFADALAEAA